MQLYKFKLVLPPEFWPDQEYFDHFSAAVVRTYIYIHT